MHSPLSFGEELQTCLSAARSRRIRSCKLLPRHPGRIFFLAARLVGAVAAKALPGRTRLHVDVGFHFMARRPHSNRAIVAGGDHEFPVATETDILDAGPVTPPNTHHPG